MAWTSRPPQGDGLPVAVTQASSKKDRPSEGVLVALPAASRAAPPPHPKRSCANINTRRWLPVVLRSGKDSHFLSGLTSELIAGTNPPTPFGSPQRVVRPRRVMIPGHRLVAVHAPAHCSATAPEDAVFLAHNPTCQGTRRTSSQSGAGASNWIGESPTTSHLMRHVLRN